MQLSKETSLFKKDSIKDDVDYAKNHADSYMYYFDSTNGLAIASANPSSATRKVQITNSSVKVQNDANNHADVTSSGLEVTQGGDSVAQFGGTARIGKDGTPRVELKDGAMIVYGSGSNEVAHVGWGQGINSSGGLSDGAYITFGGRASGSTIGNYSTAMGSGITASGFNSHAEGMATMATESYSHAEGRATKATGASSHAEGVSSEANGDWSHASGNWTIANGDAQTVVGQYNSPDTSSLFIVGKGTSNTTRSNALEVDKNGNVNIASGGKYKIGGSNLSLADLGLVTGTHVHDTTQSGIATDTLVWNAPETAGKSFIICGTQDAGNPVLRASLSSTGTITAYLSGAVTLARINYICW